MDWLRNPNAILPDLLLAVLRHPILLTAGFLAALYFAFDRSKHNRRMAQVVLSIVALISTLLTGAFVYLGFSMRWSSDGPGLLLVFIGIAVFGLIVIATFGALVAMLLRERKESIQS